MNVNNVQKTVETAGQKQW